MKKSILKLVILFTVAFSQLSYSQCTPVNCIGSLPSYGGICDTTLLTGRVNVAYSDFESFVITSSCFDAGLISPGQAGTNIRISRVDNFTYTGLPAGITAATNASSYTPPNPGNIAGCVQFSGTPTQIGIFKNYVNFLADVILCGNIPIPINDNAAGYGLRMIVLPNPAFTGLASTYCVTNNSPIVLTVTGTPGGVFSGPGVSGSTFNPATAGVGTHIIKYKVSAQQGAAIAPATDSLLVTVTVQAASFTYYVDADNDGYGSTTSITSCASTAPTGYSANNTDCNDNNNAIHPNATEVCDGIDNNCVGGIDEGLNLLTYYIDADNDGYGNLSTPTTTCATTAPTGYVANSTDCNDNNPNINPGVVEIPNNNVDENCDGSLGVIDNDNDGFDSSVDCNDNNNAIFPGANEICDGIDNNCAGGVDEGLPIFTYYRDLDADTYGSTTSISTCANTPPTGYVTNNTDCNDNNAAIHPGATEVCNNIDDNCDINVDEGLQFNTYYFDNDADGYGDNSITVFTCSSTIPTNYVAVGGDCNDTNANIHPNTAELCDGIDNNCAGGIDEGLTIFTYYRDFDTDGYGDAMADSVTCVSIPFAGYVTNNTDCNDANLDIYPGATEIPNNGIDEDCSGGDLTIGINSIQAAFGLNIYPNPAKDFVVLAGKLNENLIVTIYDLQGKQLMTRAMVQGTNYTLDIASLKAGFYMMEVSNKTTAQRGFTRIVVVK